MSKYHIPFPNQDRISIKYLEERDENNNIKRKPIIEYKESPHDQYSLNYGGIPINISKKKSYLMAKMKAHRDSMIEAGYTQESLLYEIFDPDGFVVYEHTFAANERGNAKASYHKVTPDETIYIAKNGFKLIGNSDGDIITDEKLLDIIGNYIWVNRFPVMITKAAQVSLATYQPLDRESFISLKGLGPKVYDKCGEALIGVIQAYQDGKFDNIE